MAQDEWQFNAPGFNAFNSDDEDMQGSDDDDTEFFGKRNSQSASSPCTACEECATRSLHPLFRVRCRPSSPVFRVRQE